ncbi:MAG TPA: hypothetical protein DEA62_05175 [Coxiellaceae bacterium]|nr:hypothetical protein [Coxiellaceae bacterium]
MKEIVDVLVNWVGKQGRLPMGLKYSTVSKFKEDVWDKAALVAAESLERLKGWLRVPLVK